MSEFDAAEGILAGAAVGYSLRNRLPDFPLGRLRLELEYFYRNSEYNQFSAATALRWRRCRLHRHRLRRPMGTEHGPG